MSRWPSRRYHSGVVQQLQGVLDRRRRAGPGQPLEAAHGVVAVGVLRVGGVRRRVGDEQVRPAGLADGDCRCRRWWPAQRPRRSGARSRSRSPEKSSSMFDAWRPGGEGGVGGEKPVRVCAHSPGGDPLARARRWPRVELTGLRPAGTCPSHRPLADLVQPVTGGAARQHGMGAGRRFVDHRAAGVPSPPPTRPGDERANRSHRPAPHRRRPGRLAPGGDLRSVQRARTSGGAGASRTVGRRHDGHRRRRGGLGDPGPGRRERPDSGQQAVRTTQPAPGPGEPTS